MTLPDRNKILALTAPGVVGLLILAYDYCCPGLAGLPNTANYVIGHLIFAACFIGGAITSVLAMAALQRRWDKLENIFKTLALVVNLCWLVAVIYIAVQMHAASVQH
jgi:hypothetical protein